MHLTTIQDIKELESPIYIIIAYENTQHTKT